jgi:VIT1/CCC1 family predicted Fe2+/Mn2+ transporter
MAFSEALSDDGKISGRGNPLMRGLVEGVMTFLGAIAHALPFLIPHFWTAFIVASVVVGIELVVIEYIRNNMDTPFLRAAFQIIVGGIIVLTVGILIGKS